MVCFSVRCKGNSASTSRLLIAGIPPHSSCDKGFISWGGSWQSNLPASFAGNWFSKQDKVESLVQASLTQARTERKGRRADGARTGGLELGGVSRGQSWCLVSVPPGTKAGQHCLGGGGDLIQQKSAGGEKGWDETCSPGGRQSAQQLLRPNRQ